MFDIIDRWWHSSSRLPVVAALLIPDVVFASVHLERGVDAARPTNATDNFVGIFETISNTLLLILGAVAVIMLIVGGFRYVISGGDQSAVEGAKNTILYAIIGLVVASLAYAAVDWVVERLSTGGAG